MLYWGSKTKKKHAVYVLWADLKKKKRCTKQEMKGKHVFNVSLLLFSSQLGGWGVNVKLTPYMWTDSQYSESFCCFNNPGFSSTHVFFVCCCLHDSFFQIKVWMTSQGQQLESGVFAHSEIFAQELKVCNSITQMILFIGISRTLTYQV